MADNDDSELDRLDPQPRVCKLSTGLSVDLVRLRTRQFFRLLRVLTHGAGPAMMRAGLDFKAGSEQFTQQLLVLVMMSIPDAEQEAIGFLQSMLKPTGITDKPDSQLTKQEDENNKALWKKFNADLFNPELEDTIDLIEAIVRQEAPELQALGKKLQAMIRLFQATGQDKEPPEPGPGQEELAASSGRSPRRSTSSAASTAGTTSTSSNSRSAGSARSSKQSAPAGSTSG
jgi:hypothetical protein